MIPLIILLISSTVFAYFGYKQYREIERLVLENLQMHDSLMYYEYHCRLLNDPEYRDMSLQDLKEDAGAYAKSCL